MSITPISHNEEALKQWRTTLNNGVVKSPFTPVDIPEETVVHRVLRCLKSHATLHPETSAIIDAQHEDRALTHLQIHDRALAFAAFLVSQGFMAGDRMTVALPSSIEWPIIHLGAWAAGGAVVGSSVAFKMYEIVHQLRDSASSAVVTSENFLEPMMDAAEECPSLKTIICIRSSKFPLPKGIIDFEETLAHPPIDIIAAVTLDAVCSIYYSSGTTGTPKGVIHTHRTFNCTIEMLICHWEDEIFPVLGVREVDWFKENQIITSSFYHMLGFVMLNWFLVTGSPVIIMPSFDVNNFQELIEKFKPRLIFVTPPVFAHLAKDDTGRQARLSSVQVIHSTGAPLSQELSEEFLTYHRNVRYIVQGYGSTETIASHPTILLEEGVNASVGVVGSFYEQKIVDPDTLQPCKQGQYGEVCIRGPPQTIGYLNKPEETLALIDEEGWIHTGDIGFVDGRGLLYIVDRKKELIKVNHMHALHQVPPAELEGILQSNHRIQDAAIVGIPDEERGQLVRAYVVKADDTLTERDVKHLVEERLSEAKRITGGVFFIDAIPRSTAGKILRRVLRERD